jgi:hypothetical protein
MSRLSQVLEGFMGGFPRTDNDRSPDDVEALSFLIELYHDVICFWHGYIPLNFWPWGSMKDSLVSMRWPIA